jgi:peptidoglycan/LPS O-acetylase OafA/YrhL
MLLNYGRKQLSGLAWLRFGLALYLIFFHTLPAYTNLPTWLYKSVSAGYVSTSVFFILSGCVLAHAYLDNEGKLRVSVRRFLATRILTVYPLHLLGFALAAMIMWFQYLSNGAVYAIADIPPAISAHTSEALLVPLETPELIFNGLQHLLLLHAWNPQYLTFNIPSWSISTLVFFYAVFAVAGGSVLSLRRPYLVLVVLMLVNLIPPLSLIASANFSSVATGFLHTNPLVRLPEFLTGIVLCRLMHDQQKIILPRLQFLISVVLVMGLITVIINLSSRFGPAGFYLVHNGALLPLELLLVALFAGVRDTRVVWLDELGTRLGNATLSLFILHLPIFFILSRLLKSMTLYFGSDQTGVDLATFFEQLKNVPLSFSMYPVLVLLVVVISVICQERFVLRIRRILLAPWKRASINSTRTAPQT